jgi:hypothetical protein
VAAVSRKTNTTTHEVVGVLTKGDTQIVSNFADFFSVKGNAALTLEAYAILLYKVIHAIKWYTFYAEYESFAS